MDTKRMDELFFAAVEKWMTLGLSDLYSLEQEIGEELDARAGSLEVPFEEATEYLNEMARQFVEGT